MNATSIPTSTYRLQFHQRFTFHAAREIVSYLADLGISHIYASPYFRAAPGSTHGYDICDHNQLNPEVGSREDYNQFVAELKRLGLGQVLDFVPNHMGIGQPENGWWMDVLENGPSSPFAQYFDIDWQPIKRELENRVLLPVLGNQYGRVMENGELKLRFEAGVFSLHYYDLQLPIAPRTTRPLLQHALEKLRKRGQTPPAELESIITALGHLPARTEIEPAKISERTRERQIIRERLTRLCAETPAVEEAIQFVVAELQAGGDARSFDALDELISGQPYRLSYWRVASEEINYRRFFDINNLAAIRMELPEVFEATHQLVFELIASGAITGLRIDHVDGLSNPREYFTTLQQRCRELGVLGDGERPLYLLVEKILGTGEHLRSDWLIHGTTGYEFANHVTAVLVDAEAERSFTETYLKFLGIRLRFEELIYRSKLLTMLSAMASEVNVLGHMLNRLSESNRWYRDFTLNALTTAIREVIACFPVYRTYLVPGLPPDEQDVRIIERALTAARRRNPALERTVFSFLRNVLLPPAENSHPVEEESRRAFVLKFQQITGPITAKGVEDTAFYVYNRLLALNEVGGDPAVFGANVQTFHQQNISRAEEFPQSMVASSTHDTKRSEDVRARIAALSEMPQEWARLVRRFQTANRKHRREIEGEIAPDANEEFVLYQTLLGSWPLHPMSEEEHQTYVSRIQDYMVKALHEAKVNSSWIEPNEPWDTAVKNFVGEILHPRGTNTFMRNFLPAAERISELGAVNSLAQTVLKLTVPGVPDIYQGNEIWDFSLVDPDNRRPVNYQRRRELLASISGEVSAGDLLSNWKDGRIKLCVTQRLLRLRRDLPTLFTEGNYVPVEVEGTHRNSVIAFERRTATHTLLVVVPRLSSRVGFPPIGELWKDTRLQVTQSRATRDIFFGREFGSDLSPMLSRLLAEFPVAVLVS